MSGAGADHSVSAVRKVRKHGAAATVLLTVRTTTRSMLLAQAADFIVSSGLDSWRCGCRPSLNPLCHHNDLVLQSCLCTEATQDLPKPCTIAAS